MSVQENLAFIDGQISTFEALETDAARVVQAKQSLMGEARRSLEDLRERVRSLRSSLVSSNSSPSEADVRRRLSAETETRRLESTEMQFAEEMGKFEILSREARELEAALKALPPNDLSTSDTSKLELLEHQMREMLVAFGFSSIDAGEVVVSRETYRPSHDGYDLGFDISASDMIRLIWSYLLSLLQASGSSDSNHLGILVMDEPKQHSTAQKSFGSFLRFASSIASTNKQIIVATSEPEENVHRELADRPYRLIPIEGKLLKRL